MVKTKEILSAGKEPKEEKSNAATAVREEPEQEQVEEKQFRSAPVRIGLASPPGPPSPPNNGPHSNEINFFQKSYGNIATLRHFNYSIQAKLNVSQPNDPYEQEADRIAEQVMSIPDSAIQRKPGGPDKTDTERKDQSFVQRKTNDQGAPSIQRKVVTTESTVKPELNSRIESLRGGGAPLSQSARSYFEPRFGKDFSDVRVHTGSSAVEAARAVNAKAFTLGSEIIFGAGEYAPESDEGRKLLAHELTHVVQQGEVSKPPLWQAKLSSSLPGDPYEYKAGSIADEAVRMPASVPMSSKMINAMPTTHRVAEARHVLMRESVEGTEREAAVTLSVSLDGLIFDFSGVTYSEGRTRLQMMALILRRLLGVEYYDGLEGPVVIDWEAQARANGVTLINDLDVSQTAHAGESIGQRRITTVGALLLVELLEQDYGLCVTLSTTQRELLSLGLAATSAWDAIQGMFPNWYTEFMFRREMAQQATLLRVWHNADRPTADVAAREGALGSIIAVLRQPINVLEAIRVDFALANDFLKEGDSTLERHDREDGLVAYLFLWNLEAQAGRTFDRAPTGPVNDNLALLFLAFLRTQPVLADSAAQADGHQARLVLLARFERFALRFARGTTGDEALLNQPARANAQAWKAEMTSSPPLMPPLYEAALETDHAFTIQLQWGHWTDAFAMYAYFWEFISIPKPNPSDEASKPDLSVAEGQRPSFGTVFETRLARAVRYNATDVERVRQRLGGIPWGQYAEDLVQVNNALRVVGTVIRTSLERVTQPSNVARIVFPAAGMYVVRCRAVPVLEGDEEVVRLPTVTLLPVVARDPDELAVSRTQESIRAEFDARLRIAEIQALLNAPFPPENSEALQQEMEELKTRLAEPGVALERRRQALDDRIHLIESRIQLRERIVTLERQIPPEPEQLADARKKLANAGGEAGSNWFDDRELRELRSQRETVQLMIDTRAANLEGETGVRFVPHVTFVSDLGASIELALEVYDRGPDNELYQVFIIDLTTPDSGRALGSAPLNGNPNPRTSAIMNGITELLENSSDYGRGRFAINIGGSIQTQRVEAGTGRLLSEALESSTMVLSLAAIAAAPFTEGASLYLLLPLGAIGAVPSAYRLYQRYDENRLRFDLATAMDVMNVVGGFLGLAQAATPLRMVRLGRVLMVMGIGADASGILLMGAGVVAQLEELRNLPEHERAARMLEILGNAMMQIGIQAGAAMMHARYQDRRGGAAGASEETRQLPPGDEAPGFHPPTDTTSPLHEPARSTGSGDRTMAGIGSPPTGTPPPPVAPRPSSASPEHLFELLGRGVDRALKPPPPKADIKHPPPSGEFRRGLTTGEAAYLAYNEALAVSAGREVAIYHDPHTGEYRVMIGSETGVSAPGGHGWNALVHYHPNPTGTLTFRLPAPADFNGLLLRFFAEGGLVREFVEFEIPGVGRGRTEFGIDPAHAEPYYVRIHQPDGTTQTLRFAHDGAYRAYWGDRVIYIEPGSPQYKAMIRDIQEYIRSIRGEEDGGFGPGAPSRTEGGNTGTAHPSHEETVNPGDLPSRTAASTGSSAPIKAGELQTGMGDLTDAGVAFLRKRFRSTTDRNGSSVRLDGLTDAQIRELFPNKPNWLEALVVAEARAGWLGRNTTTDFVLANPTQTLEQITTRLHRAVTEGQTGHKLNDSVLRRSVTQFVRDLLAVHDPTLEPAYNACEHHPDPAVRRRWHEFMTSTAAGDMSGFFMGTVGSKRPDVVEVMLSQNEIHVIDASFAYADPIHNFKSAFYRAVLEHLVSDVTVTATDYRAPFRQTPLAP